MKRNGRYSAYYDEPSRYYAPEYRWAIYDAYDACVIDFGGMLKWQAETRAEKMNSESLEPEPIY